MKLAVLVVIAVAMLPGVVIADDIDVVPGPRSSSVNLKGTSIDEPRAPNTRNAKDGEESQAPTIECDQGPGAKAAGLDCSITAFPGTWSPLPTDSELGDIERAIREVPMPPLELHIQPDARTLVNIDTIFYTDPTRLRRTVTLLGHSVRLDASPVSFTWVHGDDTTETTGKPGRPYPAKDVTHQYLQPGNDLRARVDTAYRVRYSVDGGGWATLDETLTAPGPTTALDVDEAAPVLTR